MSADSKEPRSENTGEPNPGSLASDPAAELAQQPPDTANDPAAPAVPSQSHDNTPGTAAASWQQPPATPSQANPRTADSTNTAAAASGGGRTTAGGGGGTSSRRPPTESLEGDESAEFYLGGLFNLEVSPGYRFLESLRGRDADEGMITHLKERTHSLHAFLLSCAEYEKQLMKRCKDVNVDLQKLRLEIDRTASKQFTENTEIGELKRELLKAENEVKLAKERESKLEKDIEESTEKRKTLTEDIDEIRRHKADMLEPQLIASSKELKLEVVQRRHQVENLEKDQEEKDATYEMVMHEVERLEMERERHAAAFSQANEMPQKIIKQAEILRDAINSLVVENVKQSTLSQQLDKELDRLAKKRKDQEEHKLDQSAEYEQRRREIHEMERQCDEIFTQHEIAKEQLAVHKGERVRLELTLKKCIFEIRREHDLLLRSLREKDALLKSLRRLDTTVTNIRLSTPLLHQQLVDHGRTLETAKRDEKHFRKQVQALRKHIDLTLYEYLKTESGERAQSEALARELGVNRRLEEELETKVGRADVLKRTVDEIKIEKELKARELIRIRNRLKNVKDDVTAKETAVVDSGKRCQEAVVRLKEFATLYDVVKNERNKYLNQIQATTQRAAEMKEKIKILLNEIEILRHEIMNKDRDLTTRRQASTAAYAQRDAAKNEANKLLLQYRERRAEIDQNLSRIETLQLLIAAAESDLVALRSRHETLLKTRNTTGTHLLDRHDELCILYEKLNLTREVAGRGELALQDVQDTVRMLLIVRSDLARAVETLKRGMPRREISDAQERIDALNRELAEAKERSRELSTTMESPWEPERTRDLGGVDPGQKELVKKIREVEEKLAEREERILEKDLILAEVSTLTDRLKRQTVEGRNESHAVAGKVNDLSKRIKLTTKAMMARVSELAMHQAMAVALYQERSNKELLLEEAKARLEAGQAPTLAIERDFYRSEAQAQERAAAHQAIAERRMRAKANGCLDTDDAFYVYPTLRTTAHPRPNAYIPDTTPSVSAAAAARGSVMTELPIPKPYGGHAPFRPREKGPQMRYFKRAAIKAVEI
ncbi:hypothetical protein HDU89_000450 [Geranomyces variabilis]|nr:hypothetical protein HDU89_000450 [Geranomyces variabilis]